MLKVLKSKIVWVYTIIGVIFGFLFPIGATILEVYISNKAFSLNNVLTMHKSNTLLLMIDSAPFFLGVVAFIAGINQYKAEESHKKVKITLTEEMEVRRKLSLAIEEIQLINNAISEVSVSLFNVFSDSKNNIMGIDKNLTEILGDTENTILDINQFNSRINNFIVSIEKIEYNTENASIISKELKNLALMGEKNVNNSIDDIMKINSYAKEVNYTVNDLDNKIKEVNKIIGLISGIYDKTNILALNAAIEAAKAGEYSGGFSIIAEQIRILAQQSKDGISDITNLLNSISRGSEKSTTYTENIAEMIENQVENSDRTKIVFKNIFTKIDKLSTIVIKLEDELKSQVKDSECILNSLDNIINSSEKTSELCNNSVVISKNNQVQLGKVESSVGKLAKLSNKLGLTVM